MEHKPGGSTRVTTKVKSYFLLLSLLLSIVVLDSTDSIDLRVSIVFIFKDQQKFKYIYIYIYMSQAILAQAILAQASNLLYYCSFPTKEM